MKQLRVDVCGSSYGESNNQLQFHESDLGGIGGDSRRDDKPKLTIYDALSYLKEVKDMFSDQSEKYDTFLDVMHDFKQKRVDTLGVIAKMKELFKGHPDLLLGFNLFLPKGYEIILNDAEEKKTYLEQAMINLMNKIKKSLENDYKYKSFMNTLLMCRMEHKDVDEVKREVAVLINDHPDLLDEFTKLMTNSAIVNLLTNLDVDIVLRK